MKRMRLQNDDIDEESGVRCSSRENVEYSMRPEVTQLSHSHIWTIRDFSFCMKDHGGQGEVTLKSPVFLTRSVNGSTSKWFLKLTAKKRSSRSPSPYWSGCESESDDDENPDYNLSLYLYLVSSNEKSVFTKFRFSVLDAKLQQIRKQRFKTNDFDENERAGFHNFLTTNGLLREDTLRIKCDIRVTVGEKETGFVSTHCSSDEAHSSIQHESKLVNQLKSLLDRKVMSDISLCAGGKEFAAHKTILAARSPVFAAMFEHDMMEVRQKKVTIEDIKPDILEEMLLFMYTDESPNLKVMAKDLLLAADKYDIERLKRMCEEVLRVKVSMDNAVEMLSLADLGSSKILKDEVTTFIALQATNLMKTNAWKRMLTRNQDLVSKAIEEASKL